jgi:hypothetical protein
VDTVSAAGTIFVQAGRGVLKFLPGTQYNISDLVPVDYVINAILAGVACIQVNT